MREKRNRFESPKFYFFQAVWLASAMLVGWLCLILFPASSRPAQAVAQVAKSRLICCSGRVPVAIILTAITLVGLPASFMLLALYFAAIFGENMGRSILGRLL